MFHNLEKDSLYSLSLIFFTFQFLSLLFFLTTTLDKVVDGIIKLIGLQSAALVMCLSLNTLYNSSKFGAGKTN
jgi:hypothetical protein